MSPSGRAAAPYLLLALVALAVFLPGIGARDLWNPDEPRYAEVTREMRESGDYLVPHLNAQIYTHKPPLMFWSMAAVAALRGQVDEVAARLPSALAAAGTILLVFALGRRLFNERSAWLSALVFGTTIQIQWQGRVGQIDMLLTFLVALAVYCWLRGYQGDGSGYYRLFFFVTGLATLAKGPVGLLPPLLAIVAFLLITRDRERLGRFHIGTGLLIWAAVGLAWLIPAVLEAGGGYMRALLVDQTLVRFRANHEFIAVYGHQRPWYYLLGVVPASSLPWSLWLPAALLAAWRERTGEHRRAALLAACWVVVTVVFFSISPAKRSVYVLTMFPGLALLIGCGLDRVMAAWPRERLWVILPSAGLAAAAIAAPFALYRAAPNDPSGGLLTREAIWLAMLPLVGFLWSAIACWRGRLASAVVAWAAVVAATFVVASVWILPDMNRVISRRPVSDAVRELVPADQIYGSAGLHVQFLFYARRPGQELRGADEIVEFAASRSSPWLVGWRSDFEGLDLVPLEERAAVELDRGRFVLLGPPSSARPVRRDEGEQRLGGAGTSSQSPPPTGG